MQSNEKNRDRERQTIKTSAANALVFYCRICSGEGLLCSAINQIHLGSPAGEGRPDIVARLCMVVDWYIDHHEYTAKIKVIPKKDYPVLMPCEF